MINGVGRWGEALLEADTSGVGESKLWEWTRIVVLAPRPVAGPSSGTRLLSTWEGRQLVDVVPGLCLRWLYLYEGSGVDT